MVAFCIFLLHAVALGYAFVTRRRDGGTSDGLLAIAFMGVVFAVGWTISTMLTNLLFTPEFFIRWYYQQTDSYFFSTMRKEFNRDAISLLFLTIGEMCFYYLLLRGEAKNSSGTEKEGSDAATTRENNSGTSISK